MKVPNTSTKWFFRYYWYIGIAPKIGNVSKGGRKRAKGWMSQLNGFPFCWHTTSRLYGQAPCIIVQQKYTTGIYHSRNVSQQEQIIYIYMNGWLCCWMTTSSLMDKHLTQQLSRWTTARCFENKFIKVSVFCLEYEQWNYLDKVKSVANLKVRWKCWRSVQLLKSSFCWTRVEFWLCKPGMIWAQPGEGFAKFLYPLLFHHQTTHQGWDCIWKEYIFLSIFLRWRC